MFCAYPIPLTAAPWPPPIQISPPFEVKFEPILIPPVAAADAVADFKVIPNAPEFDVIAELVPTVIFLAASNVSVASPPAVFEIGVESEIVISPESEPANPVVMVTLVPLLSDVLILDAKIVDVAEGVKLFEYVVPAMGDPIVMLYGSNNQVPEVPTPLALTLIESVDK